MSTHQLPDGPQTHPLVQTFQWMTQPVEYMESCAQRYGDIFTLRLGPSFQPHVLISNPQALQQIFTTDSKLLESGESAGFVSDFFGQQSILALEGKRHQRQRKLLTPPFHGERMLAYGDIICDITKQVASQWPVGEPFSVVPSVRSLIFDVIAKAIFGTEEDAFYKKFKELFIAFLTPKRPLLRASMFLFPFVQRALSPLSPWKKLIQQLEEINELLYANIRERKEQPNDPSRSDLLSMIMSARDEQGQPMTDLEIRDQVIALLVGAYEAPKTAVSWALYWIHYHSEVHTKLLQELDSLGENPDVNTILNLPYLHAVCSEVLRLYPAALLGFNRVIKSPLAIGGYQFEPGTLLLICIYLTHHRQDLYPNSKQFKPERFLERPFASYEYLPFGGGNRRCIGMTFFWFEMKLILVTILSHFQMELVDSKPIQPVLKPVIRGLQLLGPEVGPKDVRMVIKGVRSQNQRVLVTK
ncbi:cytochrome P450 [Aetokthonos hydrillicola Thurmond2011]|jgi:unspecific monooxygenase|uniref:Cytochrome P450 n=1 Tax=Aetokthonos hydrillicola Thurmond2011 TaxID=2712845 RepID=A0AAP5I4M7_9CYAN|nr:cytochrome P450 [Aetokthonos hydrillicola]MBO3462268.1 cytochrome P450 [Aetokthonos hydrillicola CCALA 1050]MBW4589489.1 cytochrome P450 [Aetokthonos hydrillicola CCALA 1050]MDR9893667.1 cytochrome P450 [Aetokthonos hydrillicola Thurmond2011]